MEKKNFEQVDVKVVPVENEDVICASGTGGFEGGIAPANED